VARSSIKRLTLYPLAIPMRTKVVHAAGARALADPVVATVELMDGTVGYGETLARPYVTGETPETVVEAARRVFVPALLEFRPGSFFEALEGVDALPWRGADGRGVAAARAAVEVALLDAYSRHFEVPLSQMVGWAGLAGFGEPGSASHVRYSAVLASSTVAGTMKWLRLAWWFGLRDFKLKVGGADDDVRVRQVLHYLQKPIAQGRASLRLDANGAWTRDEAIARLGAWNDLPLASVEQPLAKGAEADLPVLKACVAAPLMYDESLVTLEDARRLIEQKVADGFNIRVGKCGGLLPALRMAHLARRHDVAIQLGCMVGETSILSAAGRRFLELTPAVRFAEGWFGRLLLSRDVVRRSLRFGYGGRGHALGRYGLGIAVDAEALRALCPKRPVVLEF
jgi:L-Ala-D/L-Glu epimerase